MLRLFVTPQFCTGWCRPQEQKLIAVPKEMVAQYPKRVREDGDRSTAAAHLSPNG